MAPMEGGGIWPCSRACEVGWLFSCALWGQGALSFPSSVAWGNAGLRLQGDREQAVCFRHTGSVKRPVSGFPPPRWGLYPIPERGTLRFQITPSGEPSFLSEYPPCRPPVSSISCQHVVPLQRGKGRDSYSDLPRSLRGQDRSPAVSHLLVWLHNPFSFLGCKFLKFMASVHAPFLEELQPVSSSTPEPL